jgi:putative membrane protein
VGETNNMAEESNLPQKNSNELAVERTIMAVSRTAAAYDRTLMAWVRTCVSLISFGFTIYKFFQAIIEKGIQPTFGLLGPREIGIMMISMGFFSLLAATIQNHVELKRLALSHPDCKVPFSISKILAFFITLLALFLLILAVFKQ